jgi:multifunctional beta-oxidation protein
VKGQQNPGDGQNQYLDAIQKALKLEGNGTEFSYAERDVMLYNLGIGAKRTDLNYVL